MHVKAISVQQWWMKWSNQTNDHLWMLIELENIKLYVFAKCGTVSHMIIT